MSKKIYLGLIIFLTIFSLQWVSVLAEEEEVEVESSEIKRAGTYFVELEATDNDQIIIKRIPVIVTFPSTILDYQRQEGIDGSDIKVNENVFLTLSHEEIISLSNAHAWQLETGVELPVFVMNIVEGQEGEADYYVTFSTENGLEKEIKVYELNSYLALSENYISINQMNKSYTYLTSIQIFLIIILLSIIVIAILYVKRKSKEVEDVLYH